MREQCIEKISNVRQSISYHCHNLNADIEEDVRNVKNQINKMRETVDENTERLKNMIKNVKRESHEEIQCLEKTLMHAFNRQKEILHTHMQYLYKTIGEFDDLKHCTTPESVIEFHEKIISKTFHIPDLVKPGLPSFKSEPSINTESIEKYIGKITNTEPYFEELRVCQDHKIYCGTEKEAHCIGIIIISSTPSLQGCRHISLADDDYFWVSDYYGNLMLADLNGHVCKIEITKDKSSGFHTVAANGDLFCINERKKEVLRMVKNDKYDPEQKAFISNPTWKPVSIYCSEYSGDILIGSLKDKRLGARITRFDKAGKQIQQILSPDYIVPHYVTENYNGDICVSDWKKCAVIVHHKCGDHRFTYTGSHPYKKFYPSGICCDLLRNILVYDGYSKSVLILSCDGRFLSALINLQPEWTGFWWHTRGLAIDSQHNLWVGESHSNTIKIYSYLKKIQDSSI
ncbi:uncharacterized protein LOC133182484 [Saccostrea echinata]|uniref:uncharacterized protein LOC133182484 n=1 Tax=Saccostrea echinata TaxID=191078 RepID=UPI002A820009|nr:uncharacterized protein LOC133182484 [Saccostrea echinata]